MKTHVAIYDSHNEAIEAIKALNDRKFPMELVSLIGTANIVDDHIRVKSRDNVTFMPMLISLGSGVVMGFLAGMGVISFPGITFFHESGVLISTFIGFDFGLIAGAIGTIITTLLMKDKKVVKFNKHMEGNKFLVIVNGTLKEIEEAEKILHTEGTHLKAVA